MTARVVATRRRIASERLARVARRLLDAAPLCAIATVSPRGVAHVNTAYFAHGRSLEIVWLSAPESRHSRNLARRASAAVAVFDSRQRWGGADRGVQLFGEARETRGAEARAAARLYARRFPDFDGADLAAYRFYRFRPARVKLFHERDLGGGTFVTARVTRGRLAWERTERYDPSR
jgi:uncharacterized protein YhbP (UPF0306 family)